MKLKFTEAYQRKAVSIRCQSIFMTALGQVVDRKCFGVVWQRLQLLRCGIVPELNLDQFAGLAVIDIAVHRDITRHQRVGLDAGGHVVPDAPAQIADGQPVEVRT